MPITALYASLLVPLFLLLASRVALVGGRMVHAYGMSQAKEKFALRVAGVVTTFSMLGVAALACFYGAPTRGIG